MNLDELHALLNCAYPDSLHCSAFEFTEGEWSPAVAVIRRGSLSSAVDNRAVYATHEAALAAAYHIAVQRAAKVQQAARLVESPGWLREPAFVEWSKS
ncbi:MAG: hypothetical protein LC130_23055 [Bryobacterales bacterium]|nr:hypothetical protein [Bryobacterales bacterium]